MNIEIRKLAPDLVEDYVSFFDTTPHYYNKDEHKCYCVCWCSADHRIKTDFSSPERGENWLFNMSKEALFRVIWHITTVKS